MKRTKMTKLTEVEIKLTEVESGRYLIEGNDIDEIVTYCLQRIRRQSQKFYRKELQKDLENQGFSWIDNHAGLGNYYDVKLIK